MVRRLIRREDSYEDMVKEVRHLLVYCFGLQFHAGMIGNDEEEGSDA